MRTLQILGIDAGGTMTDTILIDKEGRMVIGKAATTPRAARGGGRDPRLPDPL